MSVTAIRKERTRERFAVDFPFLREIKGQLNDGSVDTSMDGSGDLILKGYASTWTLDRDNEIVTPGAFDDSLPAYLKNNPILLWQHDPNCPIGTVTKAITDQTGLYVECIIPNPGPDAADYQKAAYNSIRLGIVKTFSIGGFMTRDVEMGADGPVFKIVEVELMEISSVSIPSNASSIYEAAVKSFDGAPIKMSTRATSQLEQLIGFERIADPELVLMSTEDRGKRFELLSELFSKSHDGAVPPPLGSYAQVREAMRLGVDDMTVVKSGLAIVQAYMRPQTTVKAGKVLSAATQGKLRQAMDLHDQAQNDMADAVGSLQAVVDGTSQAHEILSGLVGEKPGVQDEDEHEDEQPEAPDTRPRQGTGTVTGAGKAADIPDGNVKCPTCKGTGKILGNSTKCPDCKGKGYVSEDSDVAQGKSGVAGTKDSDDTEAENGPQQHLIKWFNDGADGQINWGQEGDFEQCVAIAEKHITDAQGFCNERHQDATGYAPGHAPSEGGNGARHGDTGKASSAADAKSMLGDIQMQLTDQGQQMLGNPGTPADGYADEVWVYLDDADLSANIAYFCCYGQAADDRFVAVPYTVDGDRVTLDGDATPVIQQTTYVPKGLALIDGKGVLSVPSWDFAPRDTSWDGAAARKALAKWAGCDGDGDSPNSKYAQGFLFQDGDSSNFGSYKYPIATVVDGDPKIVLAAVSAAASRANSNNLTALKAPLTTLYARAAKQFDDSSIAPPWAKDDD